MTDEKRTIGDYTIIQAIEIGDYEIAVGENLNAANKEETYLCGYISNNGIFERLTDCMASDSYADILTVFGERVAEKAEEVQKQIEKEIDDIGGDLRVKAYECEPITESDDLEGKVVVIDSSILRPEYKRASHQLMLCTGGFGSKPYARGRTCFCTRIYDDFATQWRRQDVIGTVPEDKLPDWAKERLTGIRERMEAERTKHISERGDR